MFSSDTPKIIARLYESIAALQDAFAERWCVQLYQSTGERALFFAHAGAERFFYCGAWYELWSRSGFPLWYGVHADWRPAVVHTFLERHPEAIGFEGYHLCRADSAPVFEDGPLEPFIDDIENELAALTRS
jgi:hypothetical protein